MRRFCLVLFALMLLCSCKGKNVSGPESVGGETQVKEKVALKVTSGAFADGGMMAGKYTCDGENVSPPLAWSGVPGEAKSLALVCEDPDAPSGVWTHWVMFNVPVGLGSLAENVPPSGEMAGGGRQGRNDFGRTGYGGPCPPNGTHRYFFKLYALDALVSVEAGAKKDQLLKAMEGHVLGEGELMGKYERRRE